MGHFPLKILLDVLPGRATKLLLKAAAKAGLVGIGHLKSDLSDGGHIVSHQLGGMKEADVSDHQPGGLTGQSIEPPVELGNAHVNLGSQAGHIKLFIVDIVLDNPFYFL